jgi:chaperonin GroES
VASTTSKRLRWRNPNKVVSRRYICQDGVMALQPLDDRIVVRPTANEEATASGLVIPDTAKESPQPGEVLAVGPGRRADSTGELIPLDIMVGDKIVYSKYGGTEITIEGEDLLILTSRDVLAVVGSRREGRSHEASESRLSAAQTGSDVSELAWLPSRASLYMDTTDQSAALKLVEAVERMFGAFDVVISRDGPLRTGSFLQLFGLGNPKEVTQKIVEGVAAQLAGVPQAEANLRRAQAVALLVEQARDPAIPNVVLECEDFVLIKVTSGNSGDPVVVVKQLTAFQKEVLSHNAEWTLMPEKMLQLLSDQTPALAPGAESTSCG